MTLIHTEPQIPDRSKYSIGNAAKLLGISRQTLLNHTEKCLVKCGNSRNNRKFYYGSELKRYWRTMI